MLGISIFLVVYLLTISILCPLQDAGMSEASKKAGRKKGGSTCSIGGCIVVYMQVLQWGSLICWCLHLLLSVQQLYLQVSGDDIERKWFTPSRLRDTVVRLRATGTLLTRMRPHVIFRQSNRQSRYSVGVRASFVNALFPSPNGVAAQAPNARGDAAYGAPPMSAESRPLSTASICSRPLSTASLGSLGTRVTLNAPSTQNTLNSHLGGTDRAPLMVHEEHAGLVGPSELSKGDRSGEAEGGSTVSRWGRDVSNRDRLGHSHEHSFEFIDLDAHTEANIAHPSELSGLAGTRTGSNSLCHIELVEMDQFPLHFANIPQV